ncbi:MAG: DUF4335 domain-containing protein [Cyanobacteria bacterium J06633_2]
MPVSVLRRYTPPTCTLEIMADQSPLSRWSRQPILKNLRFRLSLDGPHLSSDHHVKVQGDRHHLDVLCDVVDAYIQQVLSQSVSFFQATFVRDLPSALTEHPSLSAQVSQPLSSLPPTQLEPGQSLVPPDVMTSQHRAHPVMPESNAIKKTGGMGIVIPSRMALLPRGKLKHELWWGALATDQSGTSAILSTIELFDLVNALSQYKQDHLVLPEGRDRQNQHRRWMQAAAMVVFAVGTTGVLLPTILEQSRMLTSSETASESETALEDAPPPSSQPDLPASASLSREEANSFDEETQLANRARQRAQNNDDVLLDDLESNSTSASASSEDDGTNQARADRSSSDANESSSQSNEAPDADIPPELAAIPPVEERLAEAEGAIGRTRGEAENLELSSSNTRTLRQEVLETSDFALPDAGRAPAPQVTEDVPPSGSLPQVDEVRAYFQRLWRPPADLDRSIEYQLILNPNGTLAQVTPLGQTARQYVAQARIPSIGEPFVSPVENGAQPRIRLILQPDGQVRSFLESWE